MFNLNQLLSEAVKKLGRGEEISVYEQLLLDEAKTAAKRKERLRKKAMTTHKHVTTIDTGKTKYDEKGKLVKVMVPVFRYVGHDYGKKYTGKVLRKIRKDQAKEGIKLGLPKGVTKDQIVDLWEHKDSAATTMSRQQFRAMKRQVAKQEKKA